MLSVSYGLFLFKNVLKDVLVAPQIKLVQHARLITISRFLADVLVKLFFSIKSKLYAIIAIYCVNKF